MSSQNKFVSFYIRKIEQFVSSQDKFVSFYIRKIE